MNGRKLIALLMVFALTGSGLAAQQNTYVCDKRDAFDGQEADPNCDRFETEDVTSIQQHSVFVEIVVKDNKKTDEGDQSDEQLDQHEFGAVVGLVKKCKREVTTRGESTFESQFDNAVLWFNDQFLFGTKDSRKDNSSLNDSDENVTNEGLGFQNGTSVEDEHDFVQRTGNDARWGDCYIPNGYMHAIGADDPFATGTGWNYTTAAHDGNNETAVDDGRILDGPSEAGCGGTTFPTSGCDDNIDFVKNLIAMDNANHCNGCIFEYHSTFFVVDPNGHRWMVDKMYYPLTVGDPFELGQTEGGNWADNSDCGDDNGADGESGFQEDSEADQASDAAGHDEDGHDDPAGRDSGSHADTCTDDTGDDRDNHASSDYDGGSDSAEEQNDNPYPGDTTANDRNELVEPLFTTHVQVDPLSPTNHGFADKATWSYRDGTTRNGMPYADDPNDGNYESCKNNDGIDADGDGNFTGNCAIEYNFLVTVDFAAFDNDRYCDEQATFDGEDFDSSDDCRYSNDENVSYDARGGENEVRKDWVHHGNGSANAGDSAEDGNSHPHNGNNTTGPSPQHKHDAINLDLFFCGTGGSTEDGCGDEGAPYFVVTNDPWGDEFGGPPVWTDDCSDIVKSSMGGNEDQQRTAVQVRTPIVCDADAGTDNFHRHDGTQTPQFGS